MASKTRKSANPADVRAWGRENGFEVGVQGRLNPALVKAYNAKHPNAKYREGQFVKTITVKAMKPNAKGGKTPVQRQVNLADARQALLNAGVKVGKRGRISTENLTLVVERDLLPTG